MAFNAMRSEYIDRLRKAFEMLRTETRNGQTIPYPVLNRTLYENGIGL